MSAKLVTLIDYSNRLTAAQLELHRLGMGLAASLVGRAVGLVHTAILDEVPHHCWECTRPFDASTANDGERFCSAQCERAHVSEAVERLYG